MKNNLLVGRRIMREDGIYYFCTMCGEYRHENQFYKSKRNIYKISYRCKIHKFDDKDKETLKGTEHLTFKKLTEKDFDECREFLTLLGYDITGESGTIHQQFMERHNLNK